MKSKRVLRKLSSYAMHAHGRRFSGNYLSLFQQLEAMQPKDRIVEFGDTVIAVSRVSKMDQDTYFLSFVEGEEGAQPLILDLQTGETRDEELSGNEMLGAEAHAMVNPGSRRILVEYVKAGTKAPVMAEVMERILKRFIGADFRMDFSPVIGRAFSKEIDRFMRIRLASMTLIKPNAGWDDHYTKISELLQASDGEKADLSVRAGRGQSLRKDDGIVDIIKQAADDEQPYLSDAEIVGIRAGEDEESRLPMGDYVESRVISLPRANSGGAQVSALRERMREILGIFT